MAKPGNDEMEDLKAHSLAFAIEARSIDYVPADERHGNVGQQGPFWFAGNCNFFTVALGFVGPSLGMNFQYTVIATVMGVLFGTLFMALHATQGPTLGLPQMIQSRAQFGFRGVMLPLFGTLFTFVGFNVVDSILISDGVGKLYGLPTSAVVVTLGALAALIAIIGHDWLHIILRIIFWLSIPLYIWLSVSIGIHALKPTFMPTSGFNVIAFAAQFAAGASYNITFAPYVSDYTRYLPRTSSRIGLLFSVYVGASASAIWLIVLGAWLACYQSASDGMLALRQAGNFLFPNGGALILGLAIASLIAAMGLNAYSGMLTLSTFVDCMIKLRPSRNLRVVLIAALGLLWTIISLNLHGDSISILYNALSLMLYLLAPWTSVNLVDYFLVTRGRYDIPALLDSGGCYKGFVWRGVIAYLVGFSIGVPFFNLPGIYVGPIFTYLGNVDIAWLPELVTAALFFLLLPSRRRVHDRREQKSDLT